MKYWDEQGRRKFGERSGTLLVAGVLVGSLALPVAVMSKAEAWAVESGFGSSCAYCEKARMSVDDAQHEQAPRKLSTEDEQLLRALQFTDWRFLKLPDFRERVFEAIDTPEYQELWDRLIGEDLQTVEALAPDLTSFAYDVLLPLTTDSWLNQTFSGEVQLMPQDSRNTARIEYTFKVKLIRPEVIRVGDYQDSVAQVSQMFSDLFLGYTTDELRDTKAIHKKAETFLDDWLPFAQTPEMTISNVEFAYFPPEEEQGVREAFSVSSHDKTKLSENGNYANENIWSAPTADDYVSLLTLQTSGYEYKSLATFNAELLAWANDHYDSSERIARAVRHGDLSEYLTPDERRFLELTTELSGEENHQFVVSMHTGKEVKDPCFDAYLPQRMMESDDGFAWCDLYCQCTYHISDWDAVTVDERDMCIEGFRDAVASFWENADLETLLEMSSVEITEVLEELADQCSTSHISISIQEDMVHFETMDERDICY